MHPPDGQNGLPVDQKSGLSRNNADERERALSDQTEYARKRIPSDRLYSSVPYWPPFGSHSIVKTVC